MQSKHFLVGAFLGLFTFVTVGSLSGTAQAQGGITWPQIALTLHVGGLSLPVQATHAGDGSGRLFIVEQGGTIRISQGGVLFSTPFLDISSRVSGGGEQGLLGLAFPPGYASKDYFYVNYTDTAGDTVIARYFVTADPNVANPDSEALILPIAQPFDNHNGGLLAFGPDGLLYIGMGDGGSGGDPQNNAQNPASLLGKMVRIDVESGVAPYAIPLTNPYRMTTGYRPEIWALGLRNPFRYSFDRLTGDLYVGDVGQSSFEEIDFQPASSPGGENYGWRCREGAHDFNFSTSCGPLTLVDPVAEYTHALGCSVTGGMVYRGIQFPALQGIYFYADFCSGRIWGLQRDGGGVWRTQVLLDTSHSVPSFGEDEAGEVYLVDYGSGEIYQLVNTPAASADLTGVWQDVKSTCKGAGATLRCKVTGTFEVRNEGTGQAPRTSFVGFYLSSDATLDGSDVLLRQPSVGRLKVGQSRKKVWRKTLPLGSSPSGQFVIAVVDATNAIVELDETDNIVVFGPVP